MPPPNERPHAPSAPKTTPKPTPAAPRRRWGWTVFKVLGGFVTWLLAAALVFLVIEHVLSRPAAVVATLLTALLAPMALTQLLTPALRRIDSSASFLRNLPGLMGVCALLALIVLPLSSRGPVSAALSGFPARYPGAGSFLHGVTRTLGSWIAPPPAPPPRPTAAHADGGVRDASARALDAGVAVRDVAVAHDVAVVRLDAGVADVVDVVDVVDAPDVRDVSAPDVVADAASGLNVFASVEVCPVAFSVRAGDLEGDGRDEVVVQCYETVHVLAFTEGALVERLRYSPLPPAGLQAAVGDAFIHDMDGDGRRDVILCAQHLSERGGGRGGVTLYAPNRGDGRYGDLVALDHADGCGAVAVNDVTGDGQPELVIAHTGNPYQTSQPNGDVTWFARTGRTWTRRGRQTVSKWPDRLFFADVNDDAIPDALVSHGWNGARTTLALLGSRAGLRAADAGVQAPPLPTFTVARARFDGDDTPDEARVEQGRLTLLRSQPAADVVDTFTAAPVTPPRPDAGADEDEDEVDGT